jgi:hypothetical protein
VFKQNQQLCNVQEQLFDNNTKTNDSLNEIKYMHNKSDTMVSNKFLDSQEQRKEFTLRLTNLEIAMKEESIKRENDKIKTE